MITPLSIPNESLMMMAMSTSLGEFVRRRRIELGFSTQSGFARHANINSAHLNQIEGGKIALPNADLRRKLAIALGVSHQDMLVAAGELSEEEVSTPVTHYHPNPTLARLIEAMAKVEWDENREQFITLAVKQMSDLDEARRARTTGGISRTSSDAPVRSGQDALS